MAGSSTLYMYNVSKNGGNYKVGSSGSPSSFSVANASLTVGSTFIYGSGPNNTFTYAGGADQNSGHNAAQVGFFATSPSGTLYFFSISAPYTANQNIVLNTGEGSVVCFLRGTQIATPYGETLVENLCVGDRVAIRSGGQTEFRPITWIGHRRMDVLKNPGNIDAYPVRIRANAFGEAVPHRALLITSEHCIFVDGKLIPARMLVNNGSIIVDTSITQYEYFHVELENHAILLAEGLETESYLDTGNRSNFANAPIPALRPNLTVSPLHKSWDHDAAAPLAVDRETVEPIWQRLAQRASQLGLASRTKVTLTDDPDLRLVTHTGREVRPALRDGRMYCFIVPESTTSVRLVSRASRPSEIIGPYVDDRRALGVLVGKVHLSDRHRQETVCMHLTADALEGWHAPEAGVPYRWTSGDAVLPLDFSVWEGRPIALRVEVIHAGPYVAPASVGPASVGPASVAPARPFGRVA
jgi:antigen 43